MNNIKIFNRPGTKPASLMVLSINDEEKYWIIQNSRELKNTRSRLAIEVDSETFSYEDGLELCEEGKLSVEYYKKKKIKFSSEGLEKFSGSYIIYIPSWGFYTKNKIWVLIPSANK